MNRVWVTRDEEADGPLCCALRACEVQPVLEPVLQRVVTGDVSGDLQGLGADDWLVLTSVFAIENVPMELASIPRVAVVGEASQAAALARGFRVKLVSKKRTGLNLFAELRPMAIGKRVVYPRSSLAAVPTGMDEMLSFAAPILYETSARDFDETVLADVQMITLTSASAARALDARLPLASLGVPLASIGVTTTVAIEECQGKARIQALTPSFIEFARVIAAGLAPAGGG